MRGALLAVAGIGLFLCASLGAAAGDVNADEQRPEERPLDWSGTPTPTTVPALSQTLRLVVGGRDAYGPQEATDLSFFLENRGDFDVNLVNSDWESALYKLSDAILPRDDAQLSALETALASRVADPLDQETFDTILAPALVFHFTMSYDRSGDWWVPQQATCPLEDSGPHWGFAFGDDSFGEGTYLFGVRLLDPAFGDAVVGYRVLTVSNALEGAPSPGAVAASATCGTGTPPPTPRIVVGSTDQGFLFKLRNRMAPGALPVVWHYQADGVPTNPDLAAGAARTAFVNSAARWKPGPTGSTFDLNPGADVTGYPMFQPDGVNVAGWANFGDINYRGSTGCYDQFGASATNGNLNPAWQCDMALNTQQVWSAPGLVGGKFFVEDVATHEFGHFLRLMDLSQGTPNCTTAPVYQTMCQSAGAGTNDRASLEWGDISGARYLYPPKITAVEPGNLGTRTGVGQVTAGTDGAAAFLNAGSVADLVVGWIDDPSGSNKIYYRVAFDLSSGLGTPAFYSPIKTAVDDSATGDRTGVGSFSQGLGMEIAKIGMGTAPDLLVAWVDNPSGENDIYYRILWDLDANGDPASRSQIWQASKTTAFDVGPETADLDVAVQDVNGAAPADLVFAWMDNLSGDNTVHYVVGYSLTATGAPPLTWGLRKDMIGPGGAATWEGHDTDGFGFDVVSFNGAGLDYVFAWMDAPVGDNKLYYRVGENVDLTGYTSNWYDPATSATTALRGPGWSEEFMGDDTQGLGIATGDLDFRQSDELIFVWTEDVPSAENYIHYRIEWNGQYRNHS